MFKRLLFSLAAVAAFALPCAAGVNVATPYNWQAVSNPVHIAASANNSVAMALYVDNQLAGIIPGGSMDTTFSNSAGGHYVVVQSWDYWGNVSQQALMVNIVGAPQAQVAYGNTYYDIDQMGGWEDCGACAGVNGNGPVVPYSMSQGVSNPSIDGNAAIYWIGGNTPYSSALWWKQLGAQPQAHQFSYDLYFYVNNPDAVQGLEFDINQSADGHKYIFGTECNPRGSGQWDVWNESGFYWEPTGVACPEPTPYTWHHLTIQAERSGAATHFISITMDGATSYINRYYWAWGTDASELNVAVQLDTNLWSTNYAMWVDRMSLSFQ